MIIYSNSCSFGAPGQGHKIYPEVIADHYGARLVNDGISASCNRRIIRSTLRSLIKLIPKNQSVLALVGLTFISRTELWQPFKNPTNDGDFHPIQLQDQTKINWKEGLIDTISPEIYKLTDLQIQDYYKQWLIHLSKEAEVTNLIADVIMLSEFASKNNIKIRIFCNTQKLPSSPEVDITAPFLKDFVEYSRNNQSIIDLWNFSFADYALSLGYQPKDREIYGSSGHPGESAHIKFGEYLLNNYV